MDIDETYRRIVGAVEDYDRARSDAGKADAGLDFVTAWRDLDEWLKLRRYAPRAWDPMVKGV